jgi:hypothetical protein
MKYFPERKYPRVEFHQVPWVFTLRLPDAASPDKPLRLEARNVSRGGLKFFCNRRFTLFESLRVDFLEKAGGKPLPPVLGKVVRVEEIDTGFGERTYGIAMEFTSGTAALAALPDAPAPAGK